MIGVYLLSGSLLIISVLFQYVVQIILSLSLSPSLIPFALFFCRVPNVDELLQSMFRGMSPEGQFSSGAGPSNQQPPTSSGSQTNDSATAATGKQRKKKKRR